MDKMTKQLLAHDRATLGKAISLIESTLPDHQKDIDALFKDLPASNHPFILGVSGTPGVGKSTLIDALGSKFLEKGPLAILTIDPSSHLSGGSILGDKARMDNLNREKEVYIRPSPSRGVLGGLGPKTALTVDFLSRLNFKTIIIESVGVGQSEIDLAALSDLFMVVLAPGAGDDLQGLKRGILEVADLVLINKADQDKALAKETAAFYKSSLQFLKREWPLQVVECSAHQPQTLEKIFAEIKEARDHKPINPQLKKQLLSDFMMGVLLEEMRALLSEKPEMRRTLEGIEANYRGLSRLKVLAFEKLA